MSTVAAADANDECGAAVHDEGVLLYRSSCLVLQHSLLQQACRLLIATHYLFGHVEAAEPPAEAAAREECATTSVYRAHHRLYMCHAPRDKTETMHSVICRDCDEDEVASKSATHAAKQVTPPLFASAAEAKACLQQSTLYAVLTAAHLLRCPTALDYMSCLTTHSCSNDDICMSSVRSLARSVTRLREDAAWRATALVNLSEYVTRRWGAAASLTISSVDDYDDEQEDDEEEHSTARKLQRAVETSLYDREAARHASSPCSAARTRVPVRSLLLRVFPELITGVALAPPCSARKTASDINSLFGLHHNDNDDNNSMETNTMNGDVRCGCRHRWLNEDLPRWLLGVALQEHATVYCETRLLRVSVARWRRRRGQRLLRHLLQPHERREGGAKRRDDAQADSRCSDAQSASRVQGQSSIECEASSVAEAAHAAAKSSNATGSRVARPVISLLEDSTLSNVAAALHELSGVQAQNAHTAHAQAGHADTQTSSNSSSSHNNDKKRGKEMKDEEEEAEGREASPPFSDHTARGTAAAALVSEAHSASSSSSPLLSSSRTAEVDPRKAARSDVAREHARLALLRRCLLHWRDGRYYTQVALRYMAARRAEQVQASCLHHWRRRCTRRRQRRRRTRTARLAWRLQARRVRERQAELLRHWHTSVLARRFLRARLGRRVFVRWRCCAVWAKHTRTRSPLAPQQASSCMKHMDVGIEIVMGHTSSVSLVGWAWQRWRARYTTLRAQKHRVQHLTRSCLTRWRQRVIGAHQHSHACVHYTTHLMHRVLQGWQRKAREHAALCLLCESTQQQCSRRSWRCWRRQLARRQGQAQQAVALDAQRARRLHILCWLTWRRQWRSHRIIAHIQALQVRHIMANVLGTWAARSALRQKLRHDIDEAAAWCQPRLRLRCVFATWQRRVGALRKAQAEQQAAQRVQCATVWHTRHVWAAVFCRWRMRVALQQAQVVVAPRVPQRTARPAMQTQDTNCQSVRTVLCGSIGPLHAERCLLRMSCRPVARLARPVWCLQTCEEVAVSAAELNEDETRAGYRDARGYRTTVEGLNASM